MNPQAIQQLMGNGGQGAFNRTMGVMPGQQNPNGLTTSSDLSQAPVTQALGQNSSVIAPGPASFANHIATNYHPQDIQGFMNVVKGIAQSHQGTPIGNFFSLVGSSLNGGQK